VGVDAGLATARELSSEGTTTPPPSLWVTRKGLSWGKGVGGLRRRRGGQGVGEGGRICR